MRNPTQSEQAAVPRGPVRWEALDRFATRCGWLVIIVVVLLGLALRASDLKADPPWDLSWSFAPFTDEGLNNYSARNFALYGTWKVDDFLPFVVYPLVNILVAMVFKLFGVGFVQVKLVSVLAGTVGIFIIYLLVKECAGGLAGLLAGLGVATCYPLVMYSRLGLVETVQILFLLLGGLFWGRGLKRPWLMALCGFFTAGTVLLVKISAVFIAPVMLILVVWQMVDLRHDPEARRRFLRGLLWFTAGVAAAAAVWFLVVFHPYRGEYIRYVARHSTESPQGHPKNLLAYLFNTFIVGVRAGLLRRLLPVALIGYAALPFWAAARSPGMRYLLLWFLCGLAMLGWMNYRPPRYEIILIPALVAGFAAALSRLLETGTILPASRPGPGRVVFYSLWLWPLSTQLLISALRLTLFPERGAEAGPVLGALVPAVVVGLAGLLLARSLRREFGIAPRAGRAAAALVLLLLSLGLDAGQFLSWHSRRTHNIVAASQELESLLPESAVVASSWAPTLMLGSRKRVVAVTDWANVADPVGRLGVTHLVIGEGVVDRVLAEAVGRPVLERSRVLRRYRVSSQVWTQTLQVVELPRGPADPAPSVPAPAAR